MTTPKNDHPEQGSAMIEFIALATMLFIPTLYFLITVFTIQAAGLAASAASQQGIMVVRNLGEKREMSINEVQAAARLAASNYRIDASQITINTTCLTPECDRINVQTSVQVKLPLIPWIAPQGIGTMTSEATWWGGKYR